MTKVVPFPVRAPLVPVCSWQPDRDGRLVARWHVAHEPWFAPVALTTPRLAPARRLRRLMPRLLARAA